MCESWVLENGVCLAIVDLELPNYLAHYPLFINKTLRFTH